MAICNVFSPQAWKQLFVPLEFNVVANWTADLHPRDGIAFRERPVTAQNQLAGRPASWARVSIGFTVYCATPSTTTRTLQFAKQNSPVAESKQT